MRTLVGFLALLRKLGIRGGIANSSLFISKWMSRELEDTLLVLDAELLVKNNSWHVSGRDPSIKISTREEKE